MQWKESSSKIILDSIPFSVEQVRLTVNKTGMPTSHPYTRLKAPNWVNVLPITSSGDIILIEQSRVGPMKDVLEVPGGVIDPNEDPKMAAMRELEEETGYISDEWISLGKINPNPAIMTNTLFMFVALDCRINPERSKFPDQNEDIKIRATKGNEIFSLIENNSIDSALAALTIFKGKRYWQI